MSRIVILYCILIYMDIINATHFLGGTITYKVLNTSGSIVSIVLTQTYIYDYTKITCTNTMIVNQTPKLTFNSPYRENMDKVNCTQYCNQSGGYIPPSVVSYCTDYSIALGITVGQRSDIINITNGSYFLAAYQSTSWRQLTLPSTSGSLNTTWSISCLINLQMRSDGTYNNPPAATIISPIFIPVGIPQSIFIPTIDADNDNVRCRFANGTNECGSACPPSSLPNGTVLFSNCTMIITGAKVDDWYAIAIQIEDFPNASSTVPLSSVAVQFLVNVRNVTSCSQRPLLTGPVSETGDCVGIRVGQPYTIQLIAENFCPNSTSILDIATLSFPIINKSPIVRNTTRLWSITFTWTPTASAVGTQILCAVAVDSMKAQSNQYCMTFTVAQGSIPTCPGQIPMTSSISSVSTTITTSLRQTDSATSLMPTTSNTILMSQSISQSMTTDDTSIVRTSADSLTLSSSIPSISSDATSQSDLPSSTVTSTSIFSSTNAFVSSTMLIQQSSDTHQSSTITLKSTTSSSAGVNSSWPWFPVLLAAIALLLITLCICCCWYCCPRLCPCCPWKRRRKRLSLNESLPAHPSLQSSISPYMVDDSSTSDQHLPDDTWSISRPSSVTSSRNTDDIHLTNLTSEIKIKPIPHYTLAIRRSPKVTPMTITKHLK